jgi:hypothetical protein
MIKRAVLSLMTFLLIISAITGQDKNEFSRQISVLSSDAKKQVPGAYVTISTINNKLIFCTDEDGKVTIHYKNYALSDSMLVTCIGYKNYKANISNLIDAIYLDPIDYKLNEVLIKPKKIKHTKLGNLALATIRSSQISFGCQKVLFIPNEGISGKISTIRYYMHDFSNKEFKFRPFKVRIYEPDSITGKVGNDILKNEIIAVLPRSEGNWVEINISQFNIMMPDNGVFIGLEVLPYEYYLSNGYITSRSIPFNKTQRVNSLSIGSTVKKHSKLDIQNWDYFTPSKGWIQIPNHDMLPLIQIIVE